MPVDILMMKNAAGQLVPASSDGHEALKRLPIGKPLGCKVTQPRNSQFHRKIFALLNIMYDRMPRSKQEYKGELFEQSFNSFRKEMVILAGHNVLEVMGGKVRVEAKSISYGECSQELAEVIFNDLIDLAIRKMTNVTKESLMMELDETLGELLAFAS